MSKYYKADDVINAIEDKIAEYIPYLYGRSYEMPLEIRMAIEHLPSIEVSEDNKAYTYCSRCGMRVVVDAPSATTEQSSMVGERKPIMTEEVREAIMRLSMCARHECRMCQYRLTDDVDECRDRATKCMNTIVDAFTDCGADMRGAE